MRLNYCHLQIFPKKLFNNNFLNIYKTFCNVYKQTCKLIVSTKLIETEKKIAHQSVNSRRNKFLFNYNSDYMKGFTINKVVKYKIKIYS